MLVMAEIQRLPPVMSQISVTYVGIVNILHRDILGGNLYISAIPVHDSKMAEENNKIIIIMTSQ